MKKPHLIRIVWLPAVLIVLAGLLYWLPPIHNRLSWRVDFARAYLRGVVRPVAQVPTPLPPPAVAVTSLPQASPTLPASPTPPPPTPTPEVSPTPTLVPTPIPGSISMTAPTWEKQDINNCGPATLAMYLRYYGWDGDQFTIANLLKPQREDRNVNVEELVYYARTHAGWLNVEYRVGGTLELLKKLMAAGIPVMIEESFYFEEAQWPNDDKWAAHYFLLTGYDDGATTFTGQDSFYGADRKIQYERLDKDWQSFNRVYVLLYTPDQAETVKSILGPDWDPDTNRQRALEMAEEETFTDPDNPYTWFNLGTNLVYFERWSEAARAYDQARTLGLPQRMLRYQFGPFFAYFHSGQVNELLTLTDYSLKITPNAEESFLWRGWALYRNGETQEAIHNFNSALQENPNYTDAQLALDFVNQNP
jgi:tetratricopeptide (TPR) repeat protein